MSKLLSRLALVLCSTFLISTASAQVAPSIANINGRQTTSLDGQGQAIVDPYDVGALDYRAQPLTSNSAYYKNHKPQSESELVEYDFDTSCRLNVPGDWNTQRESLLFYAFPSTIADDGFPSALAVEGLGSSEMLARRWSESRTGKGGPVS